jgi:hypothetical protein
LFMTLAVTRFGGFGFVSGALVFGAMRSLADILDAGPTPADAPEEDWSQMDELVTAVAALAERLKHEPGLSRAAAQLFVKTETKVAGIHFRSLVWPQARLLAGLPAQAKGGRRQKSGAESGRTQS